MMTKKQYSLTEAAAAIGESYSRCWHAFAYKKLPPPRRVGRTFVLTDDDIAALKICLRAQGKEAEHEPSATRRT
jgi:hypothetical protein